MVKELTILATGDICFGVEEFLKIPELIPMTKGKADLYNRFDKVSPILQQGDFTLGNLEGQISEPLKVVGGKGWGYGVVLRMPPEAADVLKKAGINALWLACNHAMTLGAEGLFQTIANLDRVGIAHSGAGANIQEARKPAILERNGVRLASLSFSCVFTPGMDTAGENKPGMATVGVTTSYEIPANVINSPGAPPRVITVPKRKDFDQMLDDVRQAKARADVVVVGFHWGLSKLGYAAATGRSVDESPCYVVDYQETLGRAAIDAGADMVFGHHPHRLQGIEIYKGKVICYSLGHLTFAFSYHHTLFGQESMIVKAYVDPSTKQVSKVNLLPMRIPPETQEPYVVPADKAKDILDELDRLSNKYGTTFRVEGEEISIQGK